MPIAAPSQLTADPLWTRARAMFARAVAAIGDAASIALLKSLPRTLRRQIVAWLCPLEHIVRKLLLAEAAELRRAQSSPGGSAGLLARTCSVHAERCGPGGPRSNLDASRPETWPVRFALSPPRDPQALPESRAPRIRALWGDTHAPAAIGKLAEEQHVRVCHPQCLARRLEALRRVLDDPLSYAERLARLLTRAVRRFPEIVRRYLFAPAHTGDYDPADPRLAVDAIAKAFGAPEAFEGSG